MSFLRLYPHQLHWLETMPEAQDLCAHGRVTVQIGNVLVSDGESNESGDWCVSAAGLYLLRTLTLDHTQTVGVGSQLIPCCGHGMFHEADTEDVVIVGCPVGIDWEVIHYESQVILRTDSGTEERVSLAEWRRVVGIFADTVEAFYTSSKPKTPVDAEDAAGYAAFWAEWKRRRLAADGF